MYPINEYKILRILSTYFDALKDSASDLTETFNYLFDILDVSEEERNGFRDTIVNNKIQYQTSYTNLSATFPNIVVIMDQEVNVESYNAIGYKLDHETLDKTLPGGVVTQVESDTYGSLMTGVYSINIISFSLLLSRLLGILVRFILFNYNSTHDDWASMDLNMDRFSPDADYFPPNSFHVHIIARFEYIESWDQIYNTLHGIFLRSCGMDFDNYISQPIQAELNLRSKSSFDTD